MNETVFLTMFPSFLYRLFDAIARYYRKGKFRREIKCPHKDFTLVGPITVINHNIIIGHHVTIYPGVMFWGDGLIEIGNNVSIGNNTIIYSSDSGGVSIGSDTQVAAQCYIIDMDHGISADKKIFDQPNTVSPVIIGKDCWLGANVTVLKGSVIEDGAVIGAKGLVNGLVEKNSIAIGIPVKVIKNRE